MGVLEFLTGGVGGKIAEIIEKRIPDRDLATKLQHEIDVMLASQSHELAKIQAETDKVAIAGQVEINKAEATAGTFRGGWRPMVGWVCASGLAYQMVFRPFLEWVSPSIGWMPPPSLELDTLLTLLFGMLGLGAMRTTERLGGKA